MSPRLGIDTTEAKTFEPIPDDQYDVVVREVRSVEQGPKAQYVPVCFEVTDGEYAGRYLWRNFVIEGPGSGFIMDLWEKATGEELEKGEIEIDTDDLVGKKLAVVTEQSEYEGNVRSEVKKILAAS